MNARRWLRVVVGHVPLDEDDGDHDDGADDDVVIVPRRRHRMKLTMAFGVC